MNPWLLLAVGKKANIRYCTNAQVHSRAVFRADLIYFIEVLLLTLESTWMWSKRRRGVTRRRNTGLGRCPFPYGLPACMPYFLVHKHQPTDCGFHSDNLPWPSLEPHRLNTHPVGAAHSPRTQYISPATAFTGACEAPSCTRSPMILMASVT